MTKSEGKYPKEFYFLILSSVTVFLASETARPILPLLVTNMGANLVELGLIIGIQSLALIVTKIPLGVLAEKVSARWIIIGSGIAQSASQLFYSLAPSLVWFFPIRVLHAISIAPIVPLAIGKTQDLAPKGKTGETLGTFLTSYGIAITFGPFLCSTLLTVFSYRQIFLINSVIPLIGVVPLFYGNNASSFQKIPKDEVPGISTIFTHIMHCRNLVILTALRVLFALAYGFFVTYFIVYAEETILLAPAIIALLLGIRGATDMMLRIPVGRLVDRIDTKYFIVSGFGLLSIAYYSLAIAIDLRLLILLMFIYGVALGFRVVSEWTLVAENSPPRYRSVIAAYLSTLFNIGSGIGEITGGILATFLMITDLFRISSLLMLAAVFITLLIAKRSIVTPIENEVQNE